jgi:hypothetical protein
MFGVGLLLLALAVLLYFLSHSASHPLMVVCGWIALALQYRSYKRHRESETRV